MSKVEQIYADTMAHTKRLIADAQQAFDESGEDAGIHQRVLGAYTVFLTSTLWLADAGMTRQAILDSVNANLDERDLIRRERGN
jgi:hypothetical protein